MSSQSYEPSGGSGGLSRDERHQRRLDRDVAASITQHPSESKEVYLSRLAELADDGRLAEVTAQLLNSTDDRVRARALEMVAKIKGWIGQSVDARSVHLHGQNQEIVLDFGKMLPTGGDQC